MNKKNLQKYAVNLLRNVSAQNEYGTHAYICILLPSISSKPKIAIKKHLIYLYN